MTHIKYKKIILAGLVIFAGIIIISAGVSSAATLTPSPNPAIPADIQSSLEGCDKASPLQSPAMTAWISPFNDAKSRSVNVDFGTPSIQLQLNYAGAYCFSGSKGVETQFKVSAISTAGVNGLLGESSALNFPGPSAPSGSYNYTKNDFTYSPPGGFTTSGSYNISVETKAANRFTTPAHRCTSNGGADYIKDFSEIDACGATGTTFSIQVNVKEPPDGSWELTGTSSVEPKSGSAGSTAVFKHTIKNLGPNTASGWIYTTRFIDYNASGAVIAQGAIAAQSNTTGSASLTNGQPVTKTDNSVIPNSWTAGFKRCQFISFDNYKSPKPTGQTFKTTQADEACFTVQAPGAPKVTLNCAASGGTYTLSGKATDPDKAGALSLQFFKNGTAINTGVTSTGSNGVFSVNVTTFMGSPVATSSFSVTAQGINSAGTPTPPNASAVTTCTVKPTSTGSGSFCPGDVKIAGNTNVQVNLPDQTPPGRTAAPTGFTTNPYATYEQDVPTGVTKVTSIQDISPGGARIGIPLVTESYQSATINYANYVSGMPYDPNQASVSYTSDYKRTDWYVVFDHYQCDGYQPASRSGTTCYYNYSAPSYQACSSGWYDGSSGKCLSYAGTPSKCPSGSYASGGSCYNSKTNTYTGPASCASGSGYYGSCYGISNSYTVYYCNYYHSGEYRSGSTCYGSYSATAYYRWVNNGTYNAQANGNASAYAMSACFDRNFQVRDVSANASYNDPEDPSAVAVSGSTNVDFIVPSGFPPAPNGLRTNVRANLSYTAGPCPNLNGNFTVYGGGLPSSGSSALGSGSCPVSAPPLVAGSTVCITYTVSPAVGRVNIAGTPQGASGSVSGSDCTNPLVNAPYVHILGQDASAGGRFANGLLDKCSSGAMSSGSIAAYTRTNGALTRGSGSQFGALASKIITGFDTAIRRPASSLPTASTGLTFANTATPLGNLGAQHCVPDYFSTRPTDVMPLADGNLDQFNGTGKTGAYSFTGDLTITRSGPSAGIERGNRIAIYVIGDVYIEKNIEFRTAGWTTTEDIPSLYIIARGNIYISPGVDVLDGVFVAQPSGVNDGVINTCAPGFNRFGASALFNNCSGRQLTVNGAFVARDINFLRTFSSLRTSLGGEQANAASTTGNCSGNVRIGSRSSADTNHDCAAEIINFSPETYLSEPSMLPVGGPALGKYDYITALSPVL